MSLVHGAPIYRGAPTKFTIVGFLNFEDHADIPRSRRFTQREEPLYVDIDEFKADDKLPHGGGLSAFYRERGFVVTDERGETRFRTFDELIQP